MDAAPTEGDREPPRSSPGRVQALDRAVALLNAVAAGSPEGRPVAELAHECGLNRATAWRLLATLEHHAMIDRDPATNRYSVGFALTRMASAAGTEGLVRRSHPILERLSRETGETANLAVAQHLGLTYVDEVTPPVVLTARWLGRQVPIHATSAGKALLAWLPEAEVEPMLVAPLTEYTDTTRTDHDALRSELAEVREHGYSVSVGEMEPHLYGVSAPLLDDRQRPFAVVSIWGPQDRVPRQRFPELGELAVRAASEITRSVMPT